MNNSEYWEKRIANKTWQTYNNLEEKNRALLEMYQEASLNIADELYRLSEKMNNSKPSLSDMHRFNRLTALQKKIESIAGELGEKVQKFYIDNAMKGFKEVYKNAMEQLGVSFTEPPKKLMEQLLRQQWEGSNFSTRLWKNTQVLVLNMNDIITHGLIQGKTITEMVIQLNNRMNKGFNETHRLVRTETMHYLNESSFKAYEDASCKEVQLWAAVDERTCPRCGVKHGNIYRMKDRPSLPLHANCRCTYLPVVDKVDELKDHDIAKEDIREEWKERERRKIKSSKKGTDTNYSYKKSDVNWSKELGINGKNNDLLNNIHTELNKFMINNKREKIYSISLNENKIVSSLEGGKDDEIQLTKEFIKELKKANNDSMILSHNHPSHTTFSRYDIQHIIRNSSIKSLTVECIDGTKYYIDRGNLKSSLIKDLGFMGKYQKIYDGVAKNYPELDDEIKIYNVWDDFLHDVNKEVAKQYGMIYKKVE